LILPVVLGAIAFALVAIFSLQGGVSGRISGSGDAQVVSSNFETDVQDAEMIIAPPSGAPQPQSPAPCGTTGTEVLSLESGLAQSGVYPTEITYMTVQQGTTSTYSLVRNVCQNGTLTSTSIISFDVSGSQTADVTCSATLATAQALAVGSNTLSVSALPDAVSSGDTITLGSGASTQTVTASSAANGALSLTVNAPSVSSTLPVGTTITDSSWTSPSNNCGAATNWISTANTTGVTLPVNEPTTGSGTSAYLYTLVATPRASAPPNPLTTVSTPTATSCGFATPGTGTYALSLCFVDFSSYNPALAYSTTLATSPGCQEMSASVPGTSLTLQFCLQVYGGPVEAHSFPTWTNAFLGNEIGGAPFYTGVPNNPALYQYDSGTTTTVNVTGVKVTSSNGTPATGWELVTGDAETTDASESITWTSNEPFSLLWNTGSYAAGGSAIGDACSAPTSPDGLTPQSMLTGGTSLTVECASTTSVSSPRTGTTMLAAPAPTTLTDVLVGEGLQGIFIGLLTPS
jgi:hypothetical protein